MSDYGDDDLYVRIAALNGAQARAALMLLVREHAGDVAEVLARIQEQTS